MKTRAWIFFTIAIIVSNLASVKGQDGNPRDLNYLLSHEKKLSTFYSFIQKFPRVLLKLPSYSGVTILAPNNEAFKKIPYTVLDEAFKNEDQDIVTSVLEYHILQGTKDAASLVPGSPIFLPTLLTSTKWTNVSGGQRVQSVKQAGNAVIFVSGKGERSTLTQPDLAFSGGKVQVINSILIPPSNITETAKSFGLDSFRGALYASGRTSDLIDNPNLTIFAPNNQAFEVIGPAITKMTIQELGSIIDYHVLPELVFSTALINQTNFVTKQGQEINILHSGNTIYVNSAQLVSTDILLANGVLHVIDNVLNPQAKDVQPNPEIASQAPVYFGASEVDEPPFTSAFPCTVSCPQTLTTSTDATPSAKNSFHTSRSKALGVAIPCETAVKKAAGLMMVLGGAAMLI
ncbi:Fasciclin-like arabinogalactan protein [Erysiphe neolycopersici]|uniref:Fasciclin-like arabinogalactan protein n=1 Tax=Erysiphe neolycopersici TaxID=212602 RepID=A0A420HUF0_9PEZI|nr:Fasciclin-like arabinogalactan protein [Erysiphe neolycopersici]